MQRLSEIAEQTPYHEIQTELGAFLAGLPFLQVTTAPERTPHDIGRPARSIVISQLINEAQQERRPVYF